MRESRSGLRRTAGTIRQTGRDRPALSGGRVSRQTVRRTLVDNLYHLEQRIRERQKETEGELEQARLLSQLAGREEEEAPEPVAIRARLGHLLVRVGTRLAA